MQDQNAIPLIWLKPTSWVAVVVFALFTLGSLALVVRARLDSPGGTTRLYVVYDRTPPAASAAASPGSATRPTTDQAARQPAATRSESRRNVRAEFGYYHGRAGLRRAIAEVVAVVLAVLFAWRGGAYLSRIALVALVVWALHWTFGIGHVMLAAPDSWTLFGPWWLIAVVGLLGSGALLTESLREWDHARLSGASDEPDESAPN